MPPAPPGVWIALALLLSLAAGAAIIGTRRWRKARGSAPWRWLQFDTLRGRLSVGVLLLALLPPVIVVGALTDRHVRAAEAAHAMQIEAMSAQIAQGVDEYLGMHVAGVRAAALALGEAPSLDRPAVEHWLERTHGIYPGFITMVAADATGRIRGATRRAEDGPAVVLDTAASVADRAYFVEAMRTGQPYVSGAFLGRRLGTDPIVAISVPVERGREGRWGVVQGALDLPALRRFERGLMRSDSQPIVITDARGIVVFASTGTGLRYLSNAADSPLLGKGEPDGRPYVIRLPGFAGGDDVSAVRTRSAQGWNIVAMTPRTSFAAEFMHRLGDALPWLAVSLLCGALLARWLSHSLSDPLDELVGRAATLRLDSPTASFRGMGPMPRELRTLARHLHRMSLRLRASYRSLDESAIAAQNARAALQEALENQERQISERTRTLAEANAELQRMSSTDSLTQLPNRRRFNEFLLQAVRNAARTETPLSCLLIDVDHFKAYNDSYGHQPGDWCLSAVGSALRVAVSRPLDMVARYGGEEFAILLLDTDPAGAATVAERARAAIEALEIEHSGSKVSKHVTISVGVCTLWPHKDTAPHDLVAFADAALYAAKAGGRNACAMRTPDGRIEVAQRAQREDPSQVRARGAAERLLQLLKRGKPS